MSFSSLGSGHPGDVHQDTDFSYSCIPKHHSRTQGKRASSRKKVDPRKQEQVVEHGKDGAAGLVDGADHCATVCGQVLQRLHHLQVKLKCLGSHVC